MDQSPMTYLILALSIVRDSGWKAKDVDWAKIESESVAIAKDASTISDTYPAIEYVLFELGDKRSFFVRAPKFKGAPKQPSPKPKSLDVKSNASYLHSLSAEKKIGILKVDSCAGSEMDKGNYLMVNDLGRPSWRVVCHRLLSCLVP